MLRLFVCSIFCLIPATASHADYATRTTGTDLFIAGSGSPYEADAKNDVFAAGASMALQGQAGGDVHASGFTVDIETSTKADLYAAGASVTVRSEIGQDVSAIGFTVRLSRAADIGGNARLMGGTVTIDGEISGALSAAGAEVILDAPVGGDAWIVAERISFGPNAKIAGTLAYSAPSEISVPERVVPEDRIQFERLDRSEMVAEMRDAWEQAEYPVLPTFMSLFAAFLITLAFLIILGAIFLTFLPNTVENLRGSIARRPGMIFLTGVIGLSLLFGMIPIAALTVVGLPFVPIVVLATVVAWTLAYVLAAYAVAMKAWQSFGGANDPSTLARLVVLAVAVTLITLLNFIPFLGWVANYTLVLLGIGAMTSAIFEWMIGNIGYSRDVEMKPAK